MGKTHSLGHRGGDRSGGGVVGVGSWCSVTPGMAIRFRQNDEVSSFRDGRARSGSFREHTLCLDERSSVDRHSIKYVVSMVLEDPVMCVGVVVFRDAAWTRWSECHRNTIRMDTASSPTGFHPVISIPIESANQYP